MPPKSGDKITFLSDRQVKVYKISLIIPALAILSMIGFFIYDSVISRSIANMAVLGTPILLLVLLYRLHQRVKPVEFDRNFLYVIENGFEVIVPLSNIKTVDIKTAGGIYEIKFFDKIQSGYELLFKPSFIYPLDYSRQDEKVNKLRAYVWKAKQTPGVASRNELTS